MSDIIKNAKRKAKAYAEANDGRRKAEIFGDKAVQKVLWGVSRLISDKTIPYLNRSETDGFMEGSGYWLEAPAKNAGWRVGFAKASVLPEHPQGDMYLGGYLAFPPNKAEGKLTEQMVRAFAFDDGSDRGINVFAVIDCVGISNTDIREIRARLGSLTEEKNIVSVNVSATHCHSGADTMGVWGDLLAALRKNPGAVKSSKKINNAVSGKNADMMDFLIETAAETIRTAVERMQPGRMDFALLDGAQFVRDKRPPYVTDKYLTVLRFTPEDGNEKKIYAVNLGVHPTCYGDKQKKISADFPYFICEGFEEAGCEGAFFQGAEGAVATDRGRFSEGASTTHESVTMYGKAIARYVLDADETLYTPVEPLLNVLLAPVMIPVDNGLMALLAKLKLVNSKAVKVTDGDDGKHYDYYLSTEIGLAQFGSRLFFALIPGELLPEIAYGGAPDAETSFNGTDWPYPPLCELVKGRLSVIGLCNDCIAYIVPDNDFGSVFSPLHYEESVSAGRRTGSNVAGAFTRLVAAAEKLVTHPMEPDVPVEE